MRRLFVAALLAAFGATVVLPAAAIGFLYFLAGFFFVVFPAAYAPSQLTNGYETLGEPQTRVARALGSPGEAPSAM